MAMMILVALLLTFVLLGTSALYWGVDSIDGMNCSEWERREHWPAARTVDRQLH